MSVNTTKTKVLGSTKSREHLEVNATLEGRALVQVSSLRYLGSLVCKDGKYDREIRSRTAMGKATFDQMRMILTKLGIGIETRMRLPKTYAWSVILFGCESWTKSKKIRRRLEAAEMWFIRRMMRIQWTARRTNEEVLQMARGCKELLTVTRRRQIGLLKGCGLERECLLGMIEGRRTRGRKMF